MSEYECVVPEMEWNLMRQQQRHVQVDQQNNNTRSSHVRPQHNLLHPIMSNNVEQIKELTWENGQPSMHGRRNHTKPIWPGTKDTLESIVHQASHTHTNNINPIYLSKMGDENNKHLISSSSGEKISVEADQTDESSILMMMMKKKRTRSESEQCGGTNNSTSLLSNTSSYTKLEGDDHYHHPHGGIRGSGSATFCKDEEDTTMMTWASFDSPTTFNTNKTFQPAPAEDSASLGISATQDEDGKTKTDQTGRSTSSRRSSRVAANHNQSERRRRDRINQKMRALQRLVPNAYKTDKASMLDEVIEYLKQLQAQVQTAMSMRNNMNNVPHFTMMPLGIAQAHHQQQQQQQQLQLSLFSRMIGLGMGMGMLDPNSVARAVAPPPPLMHPAASSAAAAVNFVPPQFAAQPPPPAVVPVAHPTVPERNNSPSLPVPDPFTAFLAQNMNLDLYNKMAALYRQQQMGTSTTHQLGTREQ